ncbi:gibberellin 20-oxidase-like protein [Chenopodium quinoa]|uniref:Fe2OG dioxygenase domain-containing protein n=1 Tax=Chenopodium quinoa TaxID=63459 RepID=A0A803KZ94_CHEQI|nr:gibberellin 20-oxidase-like protein [Chenopodium quinoa]
MSQSPSSLKLSILDLSKEPNPSSLSSLLEACKEWGFFHIINHGISEELYSKLSSFSRQIYSLPSETKLKLGPSSSVKSYTPQFIASPFYEGLRVLGPDFFSSAECSGKVLFGQKSNEFSEVVQEYGFKMTELSKRILEVILMSLGDGFEKKFYETEFGKCYGYLRIINYSPPGPSHEEVEGLGKHTDMCCMTILYPDDVSSLQVRSKEGKWMDVEPCKGSLVVNLGDMMEAWSNGSLRSSEHRVMLRKPRNRLSLAFFWTFEDEKLIFAPEEVVGEGNNRIFKPFVCLDYIRFREFDDKERYEKVGNTVRDFAGTGVGM